jgi:hypothetical protein
MFTRETQTTTHKTAKFIKTLSYFRGEAKLFQVKPKVKFCDKRRTSFIVVSAITLPLDGPETYIFPSDSKGYVLNWKELPGSFKGACNVLQALQNAGYVVTNEINSDDKK